MNLEKICFEAQKIIRQTGSYIIKESKNFNTDRVETKGVHDFVSFVDKNAEKQLVENLKLLLPQAGFIAEEQTETFRSEKYNWIIDPLDGTTNFIHGLSPFAISVALLDKDDLVMGIIYELSLDEMFYAWSGSKAFLNGKVISVSNTAKVQNALIATGFPYYNYSRLPQFMKSLDFFMRNSHGLRRLGSAATDLAYVACGRFDAFYEYSLSPWDVAAGILIVKQAGGKVCDFSGKNNYLFGKEIIASNSLIFDEFLSNIKQMMLDE